MAVGNTIGGTIAGDEYDRLQHEGGRVDLGCGSSRNVVLGNVIGTRSTSSTNNQGNANGIVINGAAGNTIGGTTAAAANVIGFSSQDGVEIVFGPPASNNVVVGNLIGTNAGGGALVNGVGIEVRSASGNVIGGTATGDANTIGFNTTAGVEIDASSVNNVVVGNFIGTDSTHDNRGNSIGVLFASDSGSNNTIGGTTAAAANTIGFNATAGIQMLSTSGTGNVVVGNLIGTDGNVSDNLNNQFGIQISGSPGNTIGGTATGAANVIGFNQVAGVEITGASASANLVAGNFLGTNSTNVHLGNGLGVSIISGAFEQHDRRLQRGSRQHDRVQYK